MDTNLTDEQVFDLVRAELNQARMRYGWWPSDMVHAAAVASEESGEVVKAANNYYWSHGDDTLDDIRKEAVQAIAMWVRFLTETPDIDDETRMRNLDAQMAPKWERRVNAVDDEYAIRPRPAPEQLDKLAELVRQANTQSYKAD